MGKITSRSSSGHCKYEKSNQVDNGTITGEKEFFFFEPLESRELIKLVFTYGIMELWKGIVLRRRRTNERNTTPQRPIDGAGNKSMFSKLGRAKPCMGKWRAAITGPGGFPGEWGRWRRGTGRMKI